MEESLVVGRTVCLAEAKFKQYMIEGYNEGSNRYVLRCLGNWSNEVVTPEELLDMFELIN